MNHRERVLAVYAHREPDRVPRYASLTPGVLDEFRRQTGQDDPSQFWDWDFGHVGFRRPDPLPDLHARFGRYFQGREVEWTLDWGKSDYPPEWGVATRSAHYYHLAAPVPPMVAFNSVEELQAYPFPDYVGEWRHDHLESQVQQIKDEGYPVEASVGWIFQTAWTLRSEVKLFEDFYDWPEFAETLLDRILQVRIAQGVRLAEAGVDTIAMNDDIGSQKGMILSPAMWRRWLKPRVAALIAAVRHVNPQIHFRYHSDGYYLPVIPDLIEIGVSVLTTVQPEAMDVYEIKRRFGQQVVLDGTLGLQSELMHGSPDEMRAKVKAQCEGLMPGGGWIASPGNGITPDVPWDNLVAMFEALDEYGQYK
jgi:uroporphyrinogen decarboxylase